MNNKEKIMKIIKWLKYQYKFWTVGIWDRDDSFSPLTEEEGIFYCKILDEQINSSRVPFESNDKVI